MDWRELDPLLLDELARCYMRAALKRLLSRERRRQSSRRTIRLRGEDQGAFHGVGAVSAGSRRRILRPEELVGRLGFAELARAFMDHADAPGSITMREAAHALCGGYGDWCAGCGGITDAYMLRDALWRQVAKRTEHYLCLQCVRDRLGRVLVADDVPVLPINRSVRARARAGR